MDACTEKFSVAKACRILSNHISFVGCKVDPSCVVKPMPQLVLFSALQTLRRETGIDAKDEIRSSAEVYVKTAK